MVGTVSTTIWLVVFCSCALSALAMRSRAAGDRISASSTTRPDRNGTSAAQACAREDAEAHAHSIAASARTVPRSCARTPRSACRRTRSPAPRAMPFAGKKLADARKSREHRSAGRAGAQLLRHARDHRVPFRHRDVRRKAGVGQDHHAVLEQAHEHEDRRALRRREELALEELHLRVLRHFERRARGAQEQAGEGRDVGARQRAQRTDRRGSPSRTTG